MPARNQRHVAAEIRIGRPKTRKGLRNRGKPRANLAPAMINGRMLSL
jgi:hypothetical protein